MSPEESAIHAWPAETIEDRQKQVDALIALANDPTHPYDGHHGQDRTVA